MKKDPYNNKRNFEAWISRTDGKKNVEGLNENNSRLLLNFLKDFKIGLNVSVHSKKGERSYSRLNHYRYKIALMMRLLEKLGVKDTTKIDEQGIHRLFNDMRTGRIKTRMGTVYKSTGDYVKAFKAFWHWHQKVMKKQGKIVEDITEDLDTRGEKPAFVYFTKEDCESIIDKASLDLKPILAFAFDSGARVTEMVNVKISDFSKDFREINIREEVSKTFGRRIKLMLCSEQIKDYVRSQGLNQDDYLCRKSPPMINKELRKLGKEILSKDQTKSKNLTLYDFRHSSACFWLPRYKSESALKYRFGWKKSDMIHYYTEFLGMKDTINEDDMYVDITKTDLEKQIDKVKKDSRRIWIQLKKQALINNMLLEAAGKDPKTAAEMKKYLKDIYALRKV